MSFQQTGFFNFKFLIQIDPAYCRGSWLSIPSSSQHGLWGSRLSIPSSSQHGLWGSLFSISSSQHGLWGSLFSIPSSSQQTSLTYRMLGF